MHTLFVNKAPLLDGKSAHERGIREHFGDRIANGQRHADDLETTFILFTNRSGSNLLTELLWTTGRFNLADEPLNWRIVISESTRRGHKTFADYLLSKCACAVDGRFVIKASIYQYAFLHREGLLDALFPRRRILISERLDKIAQSISWLVASQTKAWTSRDRLAIAPEAVTYDQDSIVRFLKDTQSTHQDMELYLNIHSELFDRVVYEDLIAAPDLTVARVLRFLGAPELVADPSKVRISKQSTEINERFRQRFLRDIHDTVDRRAISTP